MSNVHCQYCQLCKVKQAESTMVFQIWKWEIMIRQKPGPPKCIHCGSIAKKSTGKKIYPHRSDLWKKKMWKCPKCPDAYVGCYPNSEIALGSCANAELRPLRSAAHLAFDQLWKSNGPNSKSSMTRSYAYVWLATHMRIDEKDCHISLFTVEQCQRVIQIMKQINVVPGLENIRTNDEEEYFDEQPH